MLFEGIYEEALQLDKADKIEILAKGLATWMLVDGEMAGETYGVSPAFLDEEIEDCSDKDPDTIYCYSTTVLPAYQGKGLSKILCARWLGQAAQAGYHTVTGHATSPAMAVVKGFFGARFGATHEKWYGTERTARFYTLALT